MKRWSMAVVGVVSLVTSLLAVVAVTVTPAAAAPTNLNVAAGGGTADFGIQGQSFYPGVVAVHTGDSVTWSFRGAHTVNFYTNPGAPDAPGVGDGTFNGTNDPESSGFRTPGPTTAYKLTFNAPGNFIYFCALHPGMQGLVQVLDPASSTPVTTQAAADTAAGQQLGADLAAGQAALTAYKPTSQARPDGTTLYTVADGLSEPQATTANLAAVNQGGPTGTADISFTGTTLHVVMNMTGLPASSTIKNHIHSGQCTISSPPKGAANDILFNLTDLKSDAAGKATATTDIDYSATKQPPVLPANSWYVNVHDPNTQASISCGNVVAHPASVVRFLPTPLVIKQGDTVHWTVLDAHEIHPIYLGPPALEPPDPFAPPSAGTTVASPASTASSGPLTAGMSWDQTFSAAGSYQYRCTLHDDIGMTGTVAVMPTGYRTFANDGGVFAFGTSGFLGSMGGKPLNKPIVTAAATPTGKGYWLVASDGGIFAYGDAGFFGSMGGKALNSPIVGMVSTATGKGYWMVAADGGIFAFGDAGFLGSMGGKKLNKPIVGLTTDGTGKGYWMVASDGGVFAFGSSTFLGSMGGKTLNQPIVGLAGTPSGKGYIMVASDGGIFVFGDAVFTGSLGSTKLVKPIRSIVAAPDRAGYWLVATDGGVFALGSAKFFGSVGGAATKTTTVGITF